MEKDQETQPRSSDTGPCLPAGTTESEQFKTVDSQFESSGQSSSPNIVDTGAQSSCSQQQQADRGRETDRSVSDEKVRVEQGLTDRLVSVALQSGEESDENEEDFLSASDGGSDDEKIQEWGDTLPEPVDGASTPLQSDTASSRNMWSTGDSEGLADKDTPLDKDTPPDSAECESARAAAEGDVEDGGDKHAGGDARSSDCDEKDDKAEEDRQRKRQEEEDALTEEERQARLAEAVKVKVSGNEAFKLSHFAEAMEYYTQGLELCPLKYVQQRSIMFSNRAACRMKEEDYEEVVKDCSKAIDLQQTYIKALNRRADAYEKLEKLDEALKDHQKILELDRSQATSYHACMRLEQEIKDRNEKMKEEMLGKLKDLGNMVLRPFGLSTNNFKLQQDPNSGSYSVQFVQNPPSNGK